MMRVNDENHRNANADRYNAAEEHLAGAGADADVDNNGDGVEWVPGKMVNLSRESFDLLKRNDPRVTHLVVRWGEDDYVAHSVDWEREWRSIGKNTRLKVFHMCLFHTLWANIEKFRAFLRVVATNESIESLYFVKCKMEGLMDIISPFIESNNNLQDLVFRASLIRHIDVPVLSCALSERNNKHSLVELDLECNDFVQEVPKELITALSGYPNIRKLCMRVRVGSCGCVKISSMLQNSQCKLKQLELGVNTEGCELLKTALAKNTTLGDLHLSKCDIDDEGATILFNVLTRNSTLESLHLSGMSFIDIRSVGWLALSACLQRPNSPLERLSLHGCGIDDSALNAIGGALWNNTTLRILDLRDIEGREPRRLTSFCWQNFFVSLRNPTSALEELRVFESNVDDDALVSLADALRQNTSLRTLVVSPRNDITEWGWMAISDILCNKSRIDATYRSNHVIQTVFFGRNSPDTLEPLLQMNRNNDKNEVARQKILKFHFLNDDINIQVFVRMKMRVMPQAISWMGRDGTGQSLLYKLLQGMPSLFDSPNETKPKGSKRKRRC